MTFFEAAPLVNTPIPDETPQDVATPFQSPPSFSLRENATISILKHVCAGEVQALLLVLLLRREHRLSLLLLHRGRGGQVEATAASDHH